LKVVATFSILGDLVSEVGREHIDLHTLVGPNGDPHVYQPTPSDARDTAGAAIVFVNGLGFEGWIERLIGASGFGGKVVVAYALCEADPEDCSDYKANAAAYTAKLQELDASIRSAFAAIQPERRKVITTHDAFRYLSKEYGIAFLAPQGVSTEAEASAADVAALIEQIRREGVTAVFFENISDPRLVEQIARETGVAPGGALYSDALSEPSGPAATYLAMMRNNVMLLTNAMLGS
jgi:zinc/manganese transport system substrate-binding protein